MTDQKPAITITNATLTLGNKTLWRKLNLTVQSGEFIAVLGPNGAGKSSLLKAILGLYKLKTGNITIAGQSPNAGRNVIGYIPQQKAFDRDTPLRGRDLVQLGVDGARWIAPRPSLQEVEQINAVIAQVGATKYADSPLGTLSGGEQQRLRAAQALVSDPTVLLCDEPLLSLDIASQQTVSELISNQCKKGAAVLFVTHEINPILPLVDRVLYFANGNWAIGTPSEVLTSQKLSKLYCSNVQVVNINGRILVVCSDDHSLTEPHGGHHHVTEATNE